MNISFEETINVGFINVSLDIDPHDFLNCETLDDLEYDVKDYYYGNPQGEYSLGNVDVEDSTVECTIPNEFIEEWKKLKGYEDSE